MKNQLLLSSRANFGKGQQKKQKLYNFHSLNKNENNKMNFKYNIYKYILYYYYYLLLLNRKVYLSFKIFINLYYFQVYKKIDSFKKTKKLCAVLLRSQNKNHFIVYFNFNYIINKNKENKIIRI